MHRMWVSHSYPFVSYGGLKMTVLAIDISCGCCAFDVSLDLFVRIIIYIYSTLFVTGMTAYRKKENKQTTKAEVQQTAAITST